MAQKRNLKLGIPLVVLCTLLIGVAQLLFKWGVSDFSFTLQGILANYNLMAGIVLYAVGTLLLVYALKFGDLSTLFPFISLSFVWVLILSSTVLHEPVFWHDFTGIGLIIGGISLIGVGSR